MNSFVSIIIPTFNRAHLIGETLNSILAQTFLDWECVIVDDGSTDDTEKVVEDFISKDQRFKYYQRPLEHKAGGNGARNYGLKKAIGAYIVFFDSDDLMTKDHLTIKITEIEKGNYDYIITRTQYFNYTNEQIDRYYNYGDKKITSYNYITQKINWLTLDVCIQKDLAKKINFNEELLSGQEYNYFSKLTTLSVHTKFIDKVVSLRRHHEGSIRSQLKTNYNVRESEFKKYLETYFDIKESVTKETRDYLLYVCIKIVFRERKVPGSNTIKMISAVFKEYGIRGFDFIMMLFFCKYFNKGYYFFRKFEVV